MQQLGESFEDLGKDIVRETVQAPKDIVGTALESLGGSKAKSGKQGAQTTAAAPATGTEKPTVEAFGKTDNDQIKREIARRALEELSGKTSAHKEPTVWERIQKEEEEKKNIKKQKADAASKQLQPSSSKRKRGDLYGMKAKKNSAEMSRNVKSD